LIRERVQVDDLLPILEDEKTSATTISKEQELRNDESAADRRDEKDEQDQQTTCSNLS
jgi:hypothetical protein